MFNFKEILSAILVLFAVIDIVGSLPVVISLRKKVGDIQSEKKTLVAVTMTSVLSLRAEYHIANIIIAIIINVIIVYVILLSLIHI